MKTIFDQTAYHDIIHRLNQLPSGAKPQWGKMTANQMFCHLSDPMRDVLGIRKMQPQIPDELRPIIKAIVFGEDDYAHDHQTAPAYSQDEGGGGTRPTNFDQDKKALVDLLTQSYNVAIDFAPQPHAVLNVLTREEYGLYVWRHTDYHLRQFGV